MQQLTLPLLTFTKRSSAIYHREKYLSMYVYVLKLRAFDLKNRVSTFWYQRSQYQNKMVRKEKLN